jgi:protein CpxP
MNKTKFLITIIIGLFITNGFLLYVLSKVHLRKGGPKNYIIEKLHFDDEQIKKYEVYIEHHRKSIKDNEMIMNDLRNSLFEQLKQDTSKVDSLISLISKQQSIIETINYNHFLEIKRICKPSQQAYFSNLTEDISYLFSSKERK